MTSGVFSLAHFRVHWYPSKTFFQYGSSVLPRSIAAPIAGTCDVNSADVNFAGASGRITSDFSFEGGVHPSRSFRRTPSGRRPPPTIMSRYAASDIPVIEPAICWKLRPCVAPILLRK